MKPKSLIIIIAFLSAVYTLTAQIDNSFLQGGARRGEIDTLGVETGKKVVEDAEGLMEKEIDPEKYIVGPGDKFEISIVAVKNLDFKQSISPDGRLLLKGAGSVNLKDKSLAESYKIIEQKLREVYKSNDISVLLSDIRKFKVTVSGEVQRSAIVASSAMERVSEVVEKAGGLKPKSSWRRIKLFRNGISEPINVDLIKFYLIGDENSNPYVLGGDKIVVPPVNENLTISVNGEVQFPNEYEFVPGDSLSTLIKFGQGFLESSFLDSVEYARFSSDGKRLELVYLDLNDWSNKIKLNFLPGDHNLNPGDRIYIRKKNQWHEQHYAVVTGEVKYPGYYAIDENTERVRDLIARAGGFTDNASLQHSEFIRQEQLDIKDPEMERLEKMSSADMSADELKIYQAKAREKKGIMAINFDRIMNNPESPENILLHHKDSLVVYKKNNFINVQGRVARPGQVSYNPNFKYQDYIALAGGYGYRADKSETLISKPFGGLFSAEDENYKLEPGDIILVPPKKDITLGEIALQVLTVATQLVTIAGVVIAIVNLTNTNNNTGSSK